MSKRISPKNLTQYCVQALIKAGLKPDDARVVSDVLVTTDTWGTFSHGTGALINYINAIKAGGINPCVAPEVIDEGDSWALIDGHSSMGMLSSTMAMTLAIERARHNTISWVGVRNSSHFGAAGYYANMAAEQDMIGIAMSNADPNMVVPGGRGNILGNNPMAYAVPAGQEDPLLLDIALSAVAAGKIFAIKALGKSVPDTWLTDSEGLPTSDPADWPNSGSLQPMAGHKGYGLAMLIEVLAGALTGAGVLSEVRSWILESTESSKMGQAFVAINVDQIIPIALFKQRIDIVIRQLRKAPRAKGADRIYVPGEIEWEKRRDSLVNGIALPEQVFSALYRTGQRLGIETKILDGC
jgi:LDH2 family malate/lactate/ureidoglycolate dehydrogenase